MDTSTPTTRRMTRAAAVIAALSTLALAMTLLVTPALADHTGPLVAAQEIDGNASCGELGDWDFEFKIDEGEPNGTYDENTPNVVVSGPTDFEVTVVSDGDTLSFESNFLVDAVFIKGGPHGNLYDYTGIGGADHDNNLVTPDGEAVSHVSFCFDEVPDETPTPTPSPTPTPTPTPTASPTPEESEAGETATPTPTPTPEQSVAGATGTPAPSLPDGAMGFSGGTSQIPTVIFAMILLASLGTLAWANVRTVRNRS